jgi:glycerol-3-phosphate acyltransferase PlsX
MKIVIDAMGGDYAPNAIIEGTVRAVEEFSVETILVGPKETIGRALNSNFLFNKLEKAKRDKITIQDASEIIEMHEPAATSVRRKRNSSIVVGMKLLEEKQADAFVSAGNTGAVVCAATLGLRLLSGIERPGIGIIVPTLKDASLIIDVGANIDPKPVHLLQYGIMGDAYLRYIFARQNPTIGLLNIGEEETKGTEFVKETYNLLEQSHLNFIGNIEAKDIYKGKADVIICDGFVGNVTLKVSEGVAEAFSEFLRRELAQSAFARLGVLFMRPSFRKFKKKVDYAEYGGAPLLGVDGTVIIGHGRSSSNAIKNAIRVAKEEVERGVNEKIVEAIQKRN